MFFDISAGDYSATVTREGAGLASLTHRRRDLVLPHDPLQSPVGFNGRVLIPWPNRIAGGTYTFQGETHHLPVTEPDRNTALHGLQCWTNWELVRQEDDSVELRTLTGPVPGYPFRLSTSVVYELGADRGLSVTIATRNIGEEPAPYGTGTHSYLTCDGAPIERCVLRVPASEVALTDDSLIPIGLKSAIGTEFDLRDGVLLDGVSLDDAFTGLQLEPDSKTWQVWLEDTKTRMKVVLECDEPWLQLFTAEPQGRRGVAVEPMTCPPNAFNSGEDLVVFLPEEDHVSSLRIFEAS